VTDGATTAVSEFVAGASTATFSADSRELARRHILDTVASIVACRDLAPAVVARRYAMTNSGSAAGAPILGTRDRASLLDAAFASAMAAHGAEINDFMPSVYVQPGPAVVSTALCLAESRRCSGDAVVRAVIAGYELAARIPRAVGSANLRRAGLASHGVAPVFAAAAAAASLAGLPAERVADVLACCSQQATGSWQWLLDVEHIEKSLVFAGLGARNGLQAVLLVEAGFRGVRDCLDQPNGWCRSPAFTGGDEDVSALVEAFDTPTALIDAAFKRYPVGGPTQPAVAALLDVVGEVDAEDVATVRIAMPGRADAFRDAAMPALNLRYLAALILIDGHLDFEAAQSLARMHGDERIAARMPDVDVVHDPAQETGSGRDRAESARVTLTMRDGRTIERFVPHVVGFPSHPMTAADVENKARELLAPHLGDATSDRIIETCRVLDELDEVADLVALLAR
jgi:2-methylcitrate dehydratase PrpD